MECDASGVENGIVLAQETKLIAYLNEKFSDNTFNYLMYDKEMHVLVRALIA